MPYSKSTQKDYGDNPLQKRSGFKMKYQGNNSAFPFKSPIKDKIKEEKFDIDKMYEDEGIKYKKGSDEEQEVIRRQWGDDVGPPVREEDKK